MTGQRSTACPQVIHRAEDALVIRPSELLYVSGPMKGFPELNFPAFEDAARRLRSCGYRVLSPHDLGEVQGWSWADHLRRDLIAMLAAGPALSGVATLPDGPEFGRPPSRGMALETHVAAALGVTVRPVEGWLALVEGLAS